MIKCSTHIVECLRNNGIEPEATASSWQADRNPEYAINYTIDKYFFSDIRNNQWWMVDLKKNVSAHSYYIKIGLYCYWMTKWNISVSYDNNTKLIRIISLKIILLY